MADIVNFPPTAAPVSPEHEALRKNWRGVEHSVGIIMAVLDDVPSGADLTDDQRWQLQWQVEYLLTVARSPDFQCLRLPPAEYHRRRDRYMRSLGLGHLV